MFNKDLQILLEDALTREWSAISNWLSQMGVTLSNVKNYLLAARQEQYSTIYTLHKGTTRDGEILGTLTVSYTESNSSSVAARN